MIQDTYTADNGDELTLEQLKNIRADLDERLSEAAQDDEWGYASLRDKLNKVDAAINEIQSE